MPLPTTTNTTSPKAAGLDVLIESNYFQLAAQPERPFDLQEAAGEIRAASEFIRNPEDLTDREATAQLSQVDFSGGEGLDFGHRPDNTDFDKTRFWDSDGIEVVSGHGEVQKLQLESEFSTIYDQTDFNTPFRQSPQMVSADGALFVIGNGGTQSLVTRIDTPGGTPSTTSEDPDTGATDSIHTIAELDGEVFVSTSVATYRRDTSGTWTNIVALEHTRMWGLKGRLICVSQNERRIRAVDRAGTVLQTDVISQLEGGEQWLCAADAGAAILIGSTNGYVYAVADVDGSLTLRAQTLFNDEEVTAIGSGPSGVVLVGTRSSDKTRLYMAELGSSYTLQNTQLLREWDITSGVHVPVSHIHFTRDSAYFGIEDVSQQEELWRFDVTTTGLFRMWAGGAGTEGMSAITTVANKVFFSTFNHDVFGEQDTYQTSGYLISPLFDHFDAEDKVWAAAKFFGVAFPTGTSAQLFYSTDPDAIEDSAHASWTSVKTLNNASGVDDSETLIAEAESRWITLKIELSTSNTANTPQVRGYSVRAYAGPGDITMRIPINVSDYVLRPGKQAVRISGFGKTRYDQLKSYEGTAVTLKWLYTDETFEGTVKSIGTRVPLKPRRGSPLLISQVEFVGRRSS